MSKNELNIHISLNGIKMPLRINREDEILYRDAEKLTKYYIEKYRKDFSQKSSEEILTIVAYQLSVLVAKLKHHQDIKPLEKKIEELNNLLKGRDSH